MMLRPVVACGKVFPFSLCLCSAVRARRQHGKCRHLFGLGATESGRPITSDVFRPPPRFERSKGAAWPSCLGQHNYVSMFQRIRIRLRMALAQYRAISANIGPIPVEASRHESFPGQRWRTLNQARPKVGPHWDRS